ncbi:hypothetical protein JYU03_00130 [bacterium AH-315-F03]|nr:hypothetical protein [bacterium AH-315-F03]
MSEQNKITSALRDRRRVFLGLAIVMVISVLGPFKSEVTISEPVQETYDYIESLDSSSVIMVSFDFESSSFPEMKPLATALLEHLFRKQVKVVALSLFPEGAGLAAGVLQRSADERNLVYGKDYVFLGMKPQAQAAILGLGQSVVETFPDDYYGTPLAELPLMNGVTNLNSFDAVLSIADGDSPSHWVAYGKIRYGVTVLAAVAASMMTSFDAYYYGSGDLAGLIGGLRGAAEYETLLGYRGMGARSLPALSGAHMYLALIIIIGNLISWRSRRKARG